MLWFKMPPGVERISVQLQNFEAEVKHELGNFFRAPDHFAPHILSLGKFSVQEPPVEATEGLADMTATTAEYDEAMQAMAKELEAHQVMLRQANETNATLSSQLTAITADRDSMKMAGADAAGKLSEAWAELNGLKQALTDKGINPATLLPAVDAKAGAETKTVETKAADKK